MLGAAEAFARGVVTHGVPDTQMAAQSQATVERIAKLSPQATRLYTRALREFTRPQWSTADERRPYHDHASSAEHREGLEAFNQKREPRY